jgi:hypothetical protein
MRKTINFPANIQKVYHMITLQVLYFQVNLLGKMHVNEKKL